MTDDVSFLSYNIGGLVSKLYDADLLDYIGHYDFVSLSETFLDESFDFTNIFTSHVKFTSPAIKLSTQGRKSGGLLVLVANGLNNLVKQVQVDCPNMIVLRLSKKIFNSTKDVLYVSTYIPPTGSPFYDKVDYCCLITEIDLQLSMILEQNENVHLLCNGDFNARTGNFQVNLAYLDSAWVSEEDEDCELWTKRRASQDSVTNDFGKRLLELCVYHDKLLLMVVLTQFKHSDNLTFISDQGQSVVDYFIADLEFLSYVKDLRIHCRSESDHMPVAMVCYSHKNLNRNQLQVETGTIFKHVWRNENMETFLLCLNDQSFKDKLKEAAGLMEESPDGSLEVFTAALLSAAKCMEKKIVRKNNIHRNADWFDRECFVAKKEVRRNLRQFRQFRKKDDVALYVNSKKRYKGLLKKKKSDFQKNAADKLTYFSKRNSKEFWQEIRKHKQNKYTYNDISKLEWKEHFEKVFNIGVSSQVDSTTEGITNETFDEILDSEITIEEIKRAIQHLKTGKAAGPDKILAEMLKASEREVTDITVYLKKYFNLLLNRGFFPIEWTKALIVPLHKKGDTSIPDNYRGISLLSVLSKVFTHIVNSRLMKWAEEKEIINDAQAGFRKGRSTTDNIFTLNAVVEKSFQMNSKVYVAFIDFKKAYDTVNRKLLWSILFKTGIQGKMFKMLKAMYSTVQACIMSQNGQTDFFQCLQGLKQGCVVSPILFSLLINELANEIISNGRHGISLGAREIDLFLLLFADDLTLFASTIVGLQNQLNVLDKCTARLSLTVNLDKSKIIVFRKGGFLSAREKWTLNGTPIEVVNSYKYLGLIFSTKLSFSAAIEEMTIKAKKSTMEILKTLNKIGCNSPDIFFRLFDAQVAPMLLYASEIWGHKAYDQIEHVHLYACKRFLHVISRTPKDLLYGELGRFPLWILSTIRSVKYWLKLLKQPDNFFSRKAYKMLYNMDQRKHENWVSKIRIILLNNGFEQVWQYGCGNEKHFLQLLKDRLFSSFSHGWRNHIDASDRFSEYRTYKTTIQRERYISLLWNGIYRNSLAQMRIGVSQINSHKFRYSVSEKNRLCPFGCEKIESEIHFILECPKYTTLRHRYLPFLSIADANQETVTQLLKSNVDNTIINVAKFIFLAQQLRLNELGN